MCSDRLTLATLPDSVCQATPSFQPDSIRHCWAAPCVPETCGQLQGQQGINEDGEYNLKVKGKMMKVKFRARNTVGVGFKPTSMSFSRTTVTDFRHI